MGFFDKLKQGLAKTKITFGFKKVDENLLEELEENLIMADVGMESSEKIIENLRNNIKTFLKFLHTIFIETMWQ